MERAKTLAPTEVSDTILGPGYDQMASTHELVLVGTGPASATFLVGYLETAPPDAQILVLEKGRAITHAERIERLGALLRSSRRLIEDSSD